MRIKKSYVKKHGKLAGSKLLTALQKEAAHARWKAYYRKKAKG